MFTIAQHIWLWFTCADYRWYRRIEKQITPTKARRIIEAFGHKEKP